MTPTLVWNRVEDGLPTVVGDYFVIREHSELHTISIASTSFNPRSASVWYDKGFDYLYWIGPVLKPEELEFTMQGGLIRYKVRKRKTPIALATASARCTICGKEGVMEFDSHAPCGLREV